MRYFSISRYIYYNAFTLIYGLSVTIVVNFASVLTLKETELLRIYSNLFSYM